MRKGALIQFPDRILVDQVSRDHVPREGLPRSQAVRRKPGIHGWVVGQDGNNRGDRVISRRKNIRQRLAERWEIGGLDGGTHRRYASLNLPTPFFIHEEECFLPNRAAEIATGHVQPELWLRLACGVDEIVVGAEVFISVELPQSAVVLPRA